VRLDRARIRRGLAIAFLGFLGLLVVAWVLVYVASERIIRATYDVPLLDFAVQTDSSNLAEGERLARIGGCLGCHGPAMEGRVFMDERWLVRLVASDLRRVVRQQSDAELERSIRRGVLPDGRSVWAMPSPMFYHLTDEDLGAILAYMRSVEPDQTEGPQVASRMRIGARVGVLAGMFHPLVEEIDADRPRFIPDRDEPLELGRYLALTACSECHGQDLRGGFGGQAPDLRMAGAFQPDAFSRLMKEGVSPGPRELGVMADVARSRFAHFTDAEISALHLYLGNLGSSEGRSDPP
jgi:mono/diheme cytochrome c family protein